MNSQIRITLTQDSDFVNLVLIRLASQASMVLTFLFTFLLMGRRYYSRVDGNRETKFITTDLTDFSSNLIEKV